MSNRQYKKIKLKALNLVLIFVMSFLVLFSDVSHVFIAVFSNDKNVAVTSHYLNYPDRQVRYLSCSPKGLRAFFAF
jgi:hypothetical protein